MKAAAQAELVAPDGTDRVQIRAVFSVHSPGDPRVAAARPVAGAAPRVLSRVLPLPPGASRARNRVRPACLPHHQQRDLLLPGSTSLRGADPGDRAAPAPAAPAPVASAPVGRVLVGRGGVLAGDHAAETRASIARASPGKSTRVTSTPSASPARRAGVYEDSALRACDAETRARYFTRSGGSYRLKDPHRVGVRFLEVNLAVPGAPLAAAAAYDAIFCRNLLIYFGPGPSTVSSGNSPAGSDRGASAPRPCRIADRPGHRVRAGAPAGRGGLSRGERGRMIRVFVVDDSTFVRKAIVKVLHRDPELRVVGEAASGAEALRIIPPGRTRTWSHSIWRCRGSMGCRRSADCSPAGRPAGADAVRAHSRGRGRNDRGARDRRGGFRRQ